MVAVPELAILAAAQLRPFDPLFVPRMSQLPRNHCAKGAYQEPTANVWDSTAPPYETTGSS
jgi:hypothetical protein